MQELLSSLSKTVLRGFFFGAPISFLCTVHMSSSQRLPALSDVCQCLCVCFCVRAGLDVASCCS